MPLFGENTPVHKKLYVHALHRYIRLRVYFTWKKEDKCCRQSTCEVDDVRDLRDEESESEREDEPDNTDHSKTESIVGLYPIVQLAQ